MFRKLALVFALTIPLAGCANLVPAYEVLTGSLETQAPVTVAGAEKALTVAHLALNATASAILVAVQSGVLHGADALTIKDWYDRADEALKAADLADTLANAQGILDKVDAANTLINQIHGLVH